ncbi:conserved hypothetical protein [Bordetella petrii]|uniref:Uncharacterized protein n=2 Tax=Bordetella petrii TaxID=94624 RepID=A9HXQ5_BORPD|nr:conserved hypothetical protein [Bordetella petrii]
MARSSLRSLSRLQAIERRQCPPGWGSEYVPSMRATRDEAPKISRPSTVYSDKIGRDIHLMSLPERAACLLALYNPRLFDLHEQHMLSPYPTEHPLAGHTLAKSQQLPRLAGTIAVADRMNMIGKHPTVWDTDEAHRNEDSNRIPFPYIGDLLLFLADTQGAYCVNWTVKKNAAQFGTPAASMRRGDTRFNKSSDDSRHRLEEQYFADGGIRTVRVSAEEIDANLIANLTLLVSRESAYRGMAGHIRETALQAYKEILESGLPPISVIAEMTRILDCSRNDCLTLLYGAIWNRDLRVDLYVPVLPDRPLRRERSDVLTDYRHWFAR